MSAGCFCCGAPAAYVLFPLELVGCADCFRAWIREESLSVEAIEAAVGIFATDYAAHMKAFDAEMSKRTAAWVAERNRRAA